MRSLARLAPAATPSVATLSAQAAWVKRGGGMIYDTVQHVTWLADMNCAQTSGHTRPGVNTDGRMTWAAATAWANNLVYGGHSDWRLPTLNSLHTFCTGGFGVGLGLSCTGGELSRRFVTDLGKQGHGAVLNQVGDTAEQIVNRALFSKAQSFYAWSGTAYAPDPGRAGAFRACDGAQGFGDKNAAL